MAAPAKSVHGTNDDNQKSRPMAKPEALSIPEGEYRTLTEIVAAKIRESIYDGGISDGRYGPGSRLNISFLAKQLNVSTVPVREALRRLEAEGLIEFRRNRGAIVRSLSAADLRELFLIRLPLEALAAIQAAQLATVSSLQSLETILRKMDSADNSEAWRTMHEHFHHELYKMSGFPRLTELVTGLRGQMRPYVRLYADDPKQVKHAQIEHYALLRAMRRDDETAIQGIIHEHLARPARIALFKLGATPGMMLSFTQHN